jgi:hypothetical protein
MPGTRARTPQQRAARELARTPTANPYRGALSDPYSRPVAEQPAELPIANPAAGGRSGTARSTAAEDSAVTRRQARPVSGTPGSATLAGILGIALGITLGLFGLLLLTIVSLQNDYGAPDRSFYRGTDSGYVVLGLLNFALAVCCGIGGIVLMTGRLTGRIAITVGGWATLVLAAFWLLDGNVNRAVPIVLAVAAATMLFFSYQRPVTTWLGVLPPPQPE